MPSPAYQQKWMARTMARARAANAARAGQPAEPAADQATAPLVWPKRPRRPVPPLQVVPFTGGVNPFGEVEPW